MLLCAGSGLIPLAHHVSPLKNKSPPHISTPTLIAYNVNRKEYQLNHTQYMEKIGHALFVLPIVLQ